MGTRKNFDSSKIREALMRVSPISYFWICWGATSTISASFSRLTSLIWRNSLSRFPTCLSMAVGLRGDTPRWLLRTRLRLTRRPAYGPRL